ASVFRLRPAIRTSLERAPVGPARVAQPPTISAKRGSERIASKSGSSRAFSAKAGRDRKSTRLNSSHEWISYAVFCLKKKKKIHGIKDDINKISEKEKGHD